MRILYVVHFSHKHTYSILDYEQRLKQDYVVLTNPYLDAIAVAGQGILVTFAKVRVLRRGVCMCICVCVCVCSLRAGPACCVFWVV